MRPTWLLALFSGAIVAAGCTPSATPAPAAPPPPAETTTHSAVIPRAEPAPEPVAAPPAQPEGKLVCRTQTPARTYELFVNGEHGTLRITNHGGAVEDQFVQASTADGAIIVDRPGSTDLVSHLATVRTRDGRSAIRLGDWNEPWSPCE